MLFGYQCIQQYSIGICIFNGCVTHFKDILAQYNAAQYLILLHIERQPGWVPVYLGTSSFVKIWKCFACHCKLVKSWFHNSNIVKVSYGVFNWISLGIALLNKRWWFNWTALGIALLNTMWWFNCTAICIALLNTLWWFNCTALCIALLNTMWWFNWTALFIGLLNKLWWFNYTALCIALLNKLWWFNWTSLCIALLYKLWWFNWTALGIALLNKLLFINVWSQHFLDTIMSFP